MKYIFGNFVDLERLILFMELNDVDYTYECGKMSIKTKFESVVMKVIFNYVDILAIYEGDQTEEREEDDEDDDEEEEVLISELEICGREILQKKLIPTVQYLNQWEIRPGMILEKDCGDDGIKYYIPMILCNCCDDWTLYEICPNADMDMGCFEYKAKTDITIMDDVICDGVVDLKKMISDNEFEEYEFVGYLNADFYYKIVVNLFGHDNCFSNETITDFPYDFMQNVEIFSRAYPKMPAIRFYSDNKVEAIKLFLDRIYFFETSNTMELILLLAISTENNDILNLVKMLKESYPSLDENVMLKDVLDSYNEFLCDNFENHKNRKYIPINDFIKFVINSF